MNKNLLNAKLANLQVSIENLADEVNAINRTINPYQGLNGLDKRLALAAPDILHPNCFFVEAGANDGVSQSNTHFLEMLFGARGLLVEASPSRYEKCAQNRSSQNIFEHCALVDLEYELDYVKLIYSNLMTISTNGSVNNPVEHARDGKKFFKGDNYEFMAPARTFKSIFREHAIHYVDILSLDIEGAEMSALRGIDFHEVRIRNILIETPVLNQVKEYLGEWGYSLYGKLSHHDYLFVHTS